MPVPPEEPLDNGIPASGVPTKTPQFQDAPEPPDPTRYGDWELRGRCIDF
jgi:uncharacterized protein DUF1674